MTIVLKPLFSFLSKTFSSCKYVIECIILEPKLLFASSKRKIQKKFYREFNISNSLNILSFLEQWEEPLFSRVDNDDVETNEDSNNVTKHQITLENTNDGNGHLKINQTYIENKEKSNTELISIETKNNLNKHTILVNKSDKILGDLSNHSDTENKENIVPNNKLIKKTKNINKFKTDKFNNQNNIKIERNPTDDIKPIKDISLKSEVSDLNHGKLNNSSEQLQLSSNPEYSNRINDNLTTSTSKSEPNIDINQNEMKNLIKTFQESMNRMEQKLEEMKEEVVMLRKHVSESKERQDQTSCSPSTIPLFIPPPPPLPPLLSPPKSFSLSKQIKNKNKNSNGVDSGSNGKGGMDMTELLKEIKTVRLKKTSRTPPKKKEEEEDENALDHGSLLTSAFKNKFKRLNNSTDCEQEDDYGFDFTPSTSTWSVRKFQPKTTPSNDPQAFGQHLLKRRTVLSQIDQNTG